VEEEVKPPPPKDKNLERFIYVTHYNDVESMKTLKELFENVIYSDVGRKLFRHYLTKELSEEHLDFWTETEIYKRSTSQAQLITRANEIFATFIAIESRKEVNLPHSIRQQISEAISSNKIHSKLFQQAQDSVGDMLRNDSFRRFLKSDEYVAFNDPAKQLEYMEWYSGNLGRPEAEDMLKSIGTSCFLVRDSSQPNSYAISSWSQKHGIVHTLVQFETTKGYYIGKITSSTGFYQSVVDLVMTHANKEMAGFKPVDKADHQPSVRRVRINILDTTKAITIPSDSPTSIKNIIANVVKRNQLTIPQSKLAIWSPELEQYLPEDRLLNSFSFTKPLFLKEKS